MALTDSELEQILEQIKEQSHDLYSVRTGGMSDADGLLAVGVGTLYNLPFESLNAMYATVEEAQSLGTRLAALPTYSDVENAITKALAGYDPDLSSYLTKTAADSAYQAKITEKTELRVGSLSVAEVSELGEASGENLTLAGTLYADGVRAAGDIISDNVQTTGGERYATRAYVDDAVKGAGGDVDLSSYLTKTAAEETYQTKLNTWSGRQLENPSTHGEEAGDRFGLAAFGGVSEITSLGTLGETNYVGTLTKVGCAVSVGTVTGIDLIGAVRQIGTITSLGTIMTLGGVDSVGYIGTTGMTGQLGGTWLYKGYSTSADNEVAVKGDVPALDYYSESAANGNGHISLFGGACTIGTQVAEDGTGDTVLSIDNLGAIGTIGTLANLYYVSKIGILTNIGRVGHTAPLAMIQSITMELGDDGLYYDARAGAHKDCLEIQLTEGDLVWGTYGDTVGIYRVDSKTTGGNHPYAYFTRAKADITA